MSKLSEVLSNKLKEKNSLAFQVEAELPKPQIVKPKKASAPKKPSTARVDRTKSKPQLASEIGTLANSTKVPIETLRSIYFMLKVINER